MRMTVCKPQACLCMLPWRLPSSGIVQSWRHFVCQKSQLWSGIINSCRIDFQGNCYRHVDYTFGQGATQHRGHCQKECAMLLLFAVRQTPCVAGEDLGQGAATSILLWAAASQKASDISALDAFKRSVTAVAESQETCSASARMCADCIREDGYWRTDCFEHFCHLFACLDNVERSDIDLSHAANEPASEL